MALVNYPSSSEDEDEPSNDPASTKPQPSHKRKRSNSPPPSLELPPLPSKFHDLYASTVRVSTTDNPSLHGGRKRVIPHIEGNWPTHVYIEWYPSKTEYNQLSTLISSLKKAAPKEDLLFNIQSLLTSDLGVPLPLHISLSSSLGFSTEEKDEFLISLEKAVGSSGIRPFTLNFSTLDWVPNHSQTRWFLVLRLQKPAATKGLNKLLHISNKIVQEYGQAPLYTTPTQLPKESTSKNKSSQTPNGKAIMDWSNIKKDVSEAFHISIAWTLQAPSKEMIEVTRSLMEGKEGGKLEEVREIGVGVEEVKVKIGNVVSCLGLPKQVLEGKGLFD